MGLAGDRISWPPREPFPAVAARNNCSKGVQYGKSLALTEKLDRQQKAAVKVNMARLYSLQADVIHTLDVPVEGKRKFAAGQQAAANHSRQLAEAAIETCDPSDVLTRAIGHKLLAHLAFRDAGLTAK